ncbi:DUF669 domain-containing protein [Ruficoccus amylovorans]|uniref:DUF669 domain-containing protein n=1 Tax=Ruficoccus amylovorans TaxID=1804625 RepID=A0A842HB07_9BACT|nr:DUF669 domain-containing protein [Ruficoccus amylovorans]MBC2592817.1 DUF669 domain-containing protein [Ruficoccus amylovorans]
MKYTSQNADNLPRFVPNGDYLVTVIEASETLSKAGDEMIKLKLEVEGHGVYLYDYLVATESSFWKIDTFRKAIGDRVVEGEEVELNASALEGRQGHARLRIEEYQGKKSNKVELWITDNVPTTTLKTTPPATAQAQPKEDEDVPF